MHRELTHSARQTGFMWLLQNKNKNKNNKKQSQSTYSGVCNEKEKTE